MGFPNVYVVNGGTTRLEGGGLAAGVGAARADGAAGGRGPRTRASGLAGRAADRAGLRASAAGDLRRDEREFAAGHVPGARWLPRGWLELRIGEVAPDAGAPRSWSPTTDGLGAVLAAATLMELGYRDVAALAGGTKAWRQAGRPLESGLSGVTTPPDDVVPAGPSAATPT